MILVAALFDFVVVIFLFDKFVLVCYIDFTFILILFSNFFSSLSPLLSTFFLFFLSLSSPQKRASPQKDRQIADKQTDRQKGRHTDR